ncbi:unnamed protein product [Caenorhabditis auriculariae]|uniref:Uncharacterized protein n=1 Tax=Caenorhabditis auriculariae TaxID=2777116 RepID=A0A8S1HIR3_9PELO|nr:unnamed protein product [Caenorhabditis auriculariae]
MTITSLDEWASDCLLKSSSLVAAERRIIIGVCILIVSLFSFLINFFLIIAILCRWTSFSKQMYAHFVLSMLFAGLQYTSVNFYVSIPCAFTYCSYISSDSLMVALATPNTLSFFAYLFAAFAFSVFRFACFIYNKRSWVVFQKVCLYLPWVLAILIAFYTTANGCYKRYNRYALEYTYNCSACNLFFSFNFMDFNFYIGQALPLIMFGLYGTIVVMALQYILICTAQYLACLLFYMVPRLGRGHPVAVTLMNTIGSINVALNPLVLILFNTQMQKACAELLRDFGIFRNKPKFSTVAVTPSFIRSNSRVSR